jgi:hypothetical protein
MYARGSSNATNPARKIDHEVDFCFFFGARLQFCAPDQAVHDMPETVSACFATNTNLRLVRYRIPLVDHLRGQAFPISAHRTQQNVVR